MLSSDGPYVLCLFFVPAALPWVAKKKIQQNGERRYGWW